jgi:hypothetical protein
MLLLRQVSYTKFSKEVTHVIVKTGKSFWSITICLNEKVYMFRPFGFIAPKTLNYLVFQSFDFERT